MDSLRIRIAILCGFFGMALFVWTVPYSGGYAAHGPYLSVHFLDVGQGDAIFIETPDGTQVLIDGGPNSAVLTALGEVMSPLDREIDMVVSTHPDSDHIGGLIDVLLRYHVGVIMMTDNKSDSTVAATYRDAQTAEGAQILSARRGQVLQLGSSTTLQVLFPETNTTDMESNASSIVLRLVYGETSFLFTGDSPKRIEEYLVLTEGEYLQSNVLKLGHHGSRTSTSELFLDEVAPEYAVISAGKDNRYEHPHVAVTDMLFNKRIKTLSTAEEGTITFYSDGQKVWQK